MVQKNLNPQLSIIIPCLNEEGVLKNLLDDLTQQTYPLFETIIVDGGSTDKTLKEVSKFKSKLEYQLINSEKSNVCYQKNLGAKNAKSNWLVFIDADTKINPNFLQGLKFKIDEIKPDFLTTFMLPDTDNKMDKTYITLVNIIFETQKRTSNPVVVEAMFVAKKSIFNSLNGFNESIKWGEGGELLRRAQKKGYNFSVTRSPKYVYSMRRVRKDGSIKMMRTIAQFEAARLLGKNLSASKVSKMYPMSGGDYHQEIITERDESFRILKTLKQIKSIPDNLKSLLQNGLSS